MSAHHLIVGTYTRPEPHAPHARGEGLYWLTFENGKLQPGSVGARLVNPSFVAAHSGGRTVYAVSEVREGSVHSFRVTAPGEALGPLGVHSTQGSTPAHVAVGTDGRALFVTNYVSGASVLAFGLEPGGRLLNPPRTADHHGQGVHPERQEGPHAHCARPSPDGRHLYVVDLGTDEVVTYDAGSMARIQALSLPPGSGPRHLSFSPDGAAGFMTLELTSRLAVVRRDPEGGALTLLQTLPTTLPEVPEGKGGAGPNRPAEVLVSSDGRFVYVSNRGRDTVATFDWNGERAERLSEAPTLGRTPRGMVFSPGETHLLIGNQDSDTITVYTRDAATGELTHPSTAACPAPASLCFLPARV